MIRTIFADSKKLKRSTIMEKKRIYVREEDLDKLDKEELIRQNIYVCLDMGDELLSISQTEETKEVE